MDEMRRFGAGEPTMMKFATMLALAGTAFAAALCCKPPAAYAFGDAPWCAVIGLGPGDVYWDCQYSTFEACVPNVLAGNRGFCNLNPNPGPPTAAPHLRYRHHPAHHHARHG
jgi:hypothetical protein